MEKTNLILVEQCCSSLEVEFSFIHSLDDFGLIQIVVLDDQQYISSEHLRMVERAIHFHYELNINLEGIDAIHHLLEQIEKLQEELRVVNNRLNR